MSQTVPGKSHFFPMLTSDSDGVPTGDNTEESMQASGNLGERLLNEHDVAVKLGLSVGTIRRWRLIRCGPRYLKVGSAVRYKPEEVQGWIDACPRGGVREFV